MQRCIIVHLVRHRLSYVDGKLHKEVALDLQIIYSAATREQAEEQLTRFAAKWDSPFPTFAQSWRRTWERIMPFFAFLADTRR